MGVIEKQTEEERNYYYLSLKALCSISSLFSESDKPYLDYRLAENIFCRSFGAENLTRSDIAIDAKIGKIGIGIKTFVTGTTFQKIAEFDKESHRFNTGNDLDDVKAVCELRNKRLDFACNAFDVDDLYYHCIVRDTGCVSIHECKMDYIDIDRIKIKDSKKSIQFSDPINNYRFYKSKSTLLEDFVLGDPISSLPIRQLSDSLSSLIELYKKESGEIFIDPLEKDRKIYSFNEVYVKDKETESVILPLFIIKNGEPFIPEKSGLNQGFANGRTRNPNEVYISYPKQKRDASIGFFPPRYEPFILDLPDGNSISASVCQADGKSIMSNPNSALGEWLLRKVLKIPVGKLATYDLLEESGINAVKFTKKNNRKYSVDFVYIDTDSIE